MAMATFRDRVVRTYRTYRAILILTNGATPDERRLVDATERGLATAPTSVLRHKAREFQTALASLVEHYDVTASADQLLAALQVLENARRAEGGFPCVSKYQLGQLFNRYDRAIPTFPRLPMHAGIGIDIGNFRATGNQVEIYLLEASLFEDLAALWNEASRACAKEAAAQSTKVESKHAVACLRAAAKAAFNLLEGYLNGLAGDIAIVRQVTGAERRKLTEWDEDRQKAVYCSTRDKLQQYPRIALGAAHPPLQESSCAAMARVLRLEEQLRHALIHPRPESASPERLTMREQAYFSLDAATVATLCDDVLELIEQIASCVGPTFGDVSLWLRRRAVDGQFGSEVFL